MDRSRMGVEARSGRRGVWRERLRPSRVARWWLAGVLLAVSCEGSGPVDGALAERRDAAARRGIDWLVAQRGEMDPEWAFVIFAYLYPIVADPGLADSFRQIVDEASRTPYVAVPDDFADPQLLRLPTLRPLVAELWRRKRAGEPFEAASASLEALLHRHAEEFWPRVPITQQAVLLHRFWAVGIEPKRTLAQLVEQVRSTWQQGDPESLVASPSFVLGLTHVLYLASGYFSHYPDASAFEPELRMLRSALRSYLESPPPPDPVFVDVQAEVLTALKLLRVPEDDDMRAMTERLLGLQSPDGSWGRGGGNERYHATEAVVEALSDFPEAFRRP